VTDRTIETDVALDAPPGAVWAAIATAGGLASWFMPMDVEPDENGESPLGTVTAWEPGRRLSIRTPAGQAFDYRIESGDRGSVLHFVHSGVGEAEYEATRAGWEMYFHTLGQYLRHFPGRIATYVTAPGPAASARAQEWPRLLAALGLSAEPRVGDPVRITVPGVPPVDGQVDYAGPSFVGVRSGDALYRFHGRAVLGLPVAVGHHLYAGDPDPAATGRAWEAWLAEVFTPAGAA
jgi:uncharacterized protein YndB with AHSA1/START domain